MSKNLQVSKRIVSKFIERKAKVDSELFQRALNQLNNPIISPIQPLENEFTEENDTMTDDGKFDDERTVFDDSLQEVSNYERIILKSFSNILESVKAPQFVKKIEIIQHVLNRIADLETMEEYSKHNLLQFMSRKLINQTLTENLSARYYFSHSLDFDHKIKNGNLFYDPGRSNKEFKDFSKYSNGNDSNREVIYVDLQIDDSLNDIIGKARKFLQQDLSNFYRELSQFVSDEMGGEHISSECRKELEILTRASPCVPLGKIKKGLCRHRALLFKVICDCLHSEDNRIKCRLLRGAYNGAHAWNEVEDEKHEKYIIDAIQRPGELIRDSDNYFKERSKLLNVIREREFDPKTDFNLFEIEGPLGKGSQGQVFSISFEGKKYAVKNTDKSNNEVFIMSYVNHPNIIKLFNYTSENNQTSMFLEKMEIDLENYLVNDFKQLGEEQKIAEMLVILLSISYAMEYLHNRNIIHKDLKVRTYLIVKAFIEI